MYVSSKDLSTIAELTAFVDGALESADGVDDNGNDIVEYWKEFSNRVNKLELKMAKSYRKQCQKRLL